MKAPVSYVPVLPIAAGAHVKAMHGCFSPVVGHGVYNGKTGPAGGTVGEGVKVAPLFGVVNFLITVTAGGNIRRQGGFYLLSSSF